jgi:hypothetical protein
MAEKTGVFNKLWLNTSANLWQTLEYQSGSRLGLGQRIDHPRGMTGSRQMPVERNRETGRGAQGNLTFVPTPAELDALLPWALGIAKDGSNDFNLPELHNAARTLRSERDGVFLNYTGVVVGTVGFSCSEGSFLQMALGVQGTDEAATTADPATDGGGTITAVTGSPYTVNDCVLSVGGTTYQFRQFELSIDHKLKVQHNNSVTPTSIRSLGIDVGVRLGLPYGDVTALYGAGAAGAAIVATYTNGVDSLRFTLPAVVFPKPDPEFGTVDNMTFQLQGNAFRKADGTSLLTVRHVNA